MNYIKKLFLLTLTTLSFAQEAENKEWKLDRINFYIENDVYFGTDNGYSTGEMFTFLFFVPQADYLLYDILGYKSEETYSYFTFSLANQVFTPTNTVSTSFQANDRPYAGWTYMEAAMHKTTKTQLRSLSLKVGMVGPSSASEEIQNNFHKIFNLYQVNGWEHQLDNELGINLKLTQKWKYHGKSYNGFEASFIPFTSAELGNIAINASAGFSARFGINIPKDYGLSTVNIANDPGIPVYGEYKNRFQKDWSFSFNLTAAGTVVARDLFLDGSTFRDSHSVEKELFYNYYGLGFSTRYKNLAVDLMAFEFSKQFKQQKESHGIGTVIVSWIF